MNTTAMFIIWAVSFLIGSIVSYIRYRIKKRRSDKMIVEEIKRIQKQLKYAENGINCKIEL